MRASKPRLADFAAESSSEIDSDDSFKENITWSAKRAQIAKGKTIEDIQVGKLGE
jgi:hypothetical protein